MGANDVQDCKAAKSMEMSDEGLSVNSAGLCEFTPLGRGQRSDFQVSLLSDPTNGEHGSTLSLDQRYNNLSSVIGKSRTRLPVALNIALATAAAAPVMPSSPTPRAPIGVCSSGMSVQRISMGGTSRLTGT